MAVAVGEAVAAHVVFYDRIGADTEGLVHDVAQEVQAVGLLLHAAMGQTIEHAEDNGDDQGDDDEGQHPVHQMAVGRMIGEPLLAQLLERAVELHAGYLVVNLLKQGLVVARQMEMAR